MDSHIIGIGQMKLFVVILQASDGLLSYTVEAIDKKAATGEAIRRAVNTDSIKWPLIQTMAVLVESPPLAEEPIKMKSLIHIRGLIKALGSYQVGMANSTNLEERDNVRKNLTEWLALYDITASFAREKDFEDASE